MEDYGSASPSARLPRTRRPGPYTRSRLRPLPPEEYGFFFKAHAFSGADDAEADPRLAVAAKRLRLRLRGSFYGAKVVGALLRSRPDHRLWRRVLAAGHAESSWSWFANGDYVAASTCGVAVSPRA